MRLALLRLSRRTCRLAVFAAFLAFVVAVTGFEAEAHGHVAPVDGWRHATTPGSSAHDTGLNSCSICRLAHETSSGPIAPGTVSRPLPRIAPTAPGRSFITAAAPARKQRSRAPPCVASC